MFNSTKNRKFDLCQNFESGYLGLGIKAGILQIHYKSQRFGIDTGRIVDISAPESSLSCTEDEPSG
jgi:hypothetical protein